MRIGIVEDDPVLRDGLCRTIAARPELSLIGAVGSVGDGLELLRCGLDVLLVDLGLPDGSGLDLIAAAGEGPAPCKVLVLTVFADVRSVLRAIEAGADGYLLKESDIEGISSAIRVVLDGGAPISPAVASHILARLRVEPPRRAKPASRDGGLTAKETDVLEALAAGLSHKEVAAQLGISPHTVSDHVKSIYRKLSVNSRGEAVYKAMQGGIIRMAR